MRNIIPSKITKSNKDNKYTAHHTYNTLKMEMEVNVLNYPE